MFILISLDSGANIEKYLEQNAFTLFFCLRYSVKKKKKRNILKSLGVVEVFEAKLDEVLSHLV